MDRQNTGPRAAATPWDEQGGFWARWNRFFYRFLGPAQNQPIPGEKPWQPNPDAPCPMCAKPLSQHVFERGGPGEKTYMHCPDS